MSEQRFQDYSLKYMPRLGDSVVFGEGGRGIIVGIDQINNSDGQSYEQIVTVAGTGLKNGALLKFKETITYLEEENIENVSFGSNRLVFKELTLKVPHLDYDHLCMLVDENIDLENLIIIKRDVGRNLVGSIEKIKHDPEEDEDYPHMKLGVMWKEISTISDIVDSDREYQSSENLIVDEKGRHHMRILTGNELDIYTAFAKKDVEKIPKIKIKTFKELLDEI